MSSDIAMRQIDITKPALSLPHVAQSEAAVRKVEYWIEQFRPQFTWLGLSCMNILSISARAKIRVRKISDPDCTDTDVYDDAADGKRFPMILQDSTIRRIIGIEW